MSDEQLSQAADILHVPTTLAPIAVAYNLSAAPDELHLSPEILAGIFLGDITSWNDSRIAQLNGGAPLPAAPLPVVHRSDGSGTTRVFTAYLEAVSPQWKQKVGSHTSVNWPTGVGADGSGGVAQLLRRTDGGIGYVVLSFARANKLKVAALWNRAGRFV